MKKGHNLSQSEVIVRFHGPASMNWLRSSFLRSNVGAILRPVSAAAV